MTSPRLIAFEEIGSPQIGFISVAEINKKLPFLVKRVYWTYYTPNHVIRGGHSHKNLEQLIVAVSGIIEFDLEDTSGNKYSFTLDTPSIGLLIPSNYWRKIRFSHNAVMLCMASDIYKESDYIREYKIFKQIK